MREREVGCGECSQTGSGGGSGLSCRHCHGAGAIWIEEEDDDTFEAESTSRANPWLIAPRAEAIPSAPPLPE